MFFDLKDTTVNINKITEVKVSGNNTLDITFGDGKARVYRANGDAHITARQMTNDFIVQVIPCHAPVFNVYEESNENGQRIYFHERVNFFALCIDGTVRSLSNADGFYDFVDGAKNFVGFFDEDMLGGFPTQES